MSNTLLYIYVGAHFVDLQLELSEMGASLFPSTGGLDVLGHRFTGPGPSL